MEKDNLQRSKDTSQGCAGCLEIDERTTRCPNMVKEENANIAYFGDSLKLEKVVLFENMPLVQNI